MSNKLIIKNMVCPRCISTVDSILSGLNINVKSVQLGYVLLQDEINQEQKEAFKNKLEENGFELLKDNKSIIINGIKTLLLEQARTQNPPSVNLSAYISGKLNHDYAYLSRLFSSVEGITIEKYLTLQKTEFVKELLFYNEKTISEIAYALGYSSPAHLSNQFKKETGMTPGAFRKLKEPGHKSLDSL